MDTPEIGHLFNLDTIVIPNYSVHVHTCNCTTLEMWTPHSSGHFPLSQGCLRWRDSTIAVLNIFLMGVSVEACYCLDSVCNLFASSLHDG